MDFLVYKISELPTELALVDILPEQERAESLRRKGHYAATRVLLRQEISRRTHTIAKEIEISYGEHGKPECSLQPFNISHYGDCLCLAFHHKAIGVDVEYMKERNFAALASRFMPPEQLAAFMGRQCPLHEFYACWCAAEAIIKHAGDTIWHAPGYPFLYQQGRIKCLFENAPVVELFTPMPGYCGAVAYTP